MFSGIVAEVGIVKAFEGDESAATLSIEASPAFVDVSIGESIAVNGVCLTAVQQQGQTFVVDISPETLRATNLGTLRPGDDVNLERSLCLNDRLGGHLVSGHVDGVGTIVDVRAEANAVHYAIRAPKGLMRYLVPKGSIAVDGISLTVMASHAETFQITIIPHTAAVTTIGRKGTGATVNLECDMIGKYVERLLQARLDGEDAEPAALLSVLLRRHGLAEEGE